MSTNVSEAPAGNWSRSTKRSVQLGRFRRRFLPLRSQGRGKKTAEIAIEQDEEVRRVLDRASRERHTDLEAWETTLRAVVLAAGANALGELLQGIGCGRRDEPVMCNCGETMESQGLKPKPILSILGLVPYRRSMFQCPRCGATRYPGDEALDIVSTTRSPGLRRMMARAGSRSTFKEAREDLNVYAGIDVSAKDVERVAEAVGEDMERWATQERKALINQAPPARPNIDIPVLYVCYDGTGIPMVPAALQGRKGKRPDGSARTREVKLGCVFTQTATDERGFAVRDPASSSFVGAIETAETFGWRIYAEAVRRGLYNAERVVVLGDGAVWIRNIAQHHFPNATQIIDLYHVREHVSDLCKILSDPDPTRVARLRDQWWRLLDAGDIEGILSEASEGLPEDPDTREKAKAEMAYLDNNRERMRYAKFRALGLFVGSGVVEAGCKTVVGQRLKQSGMEWSVRGANAIIALRCNLYSGRFEDYWEDRVA